MVRRGGPFASLPYQRLAGLTYVAALGASYAGVTGTTFSGTVNLPASAGKYTCPSTTIRAPAPAASEAPVRDSGKLPDLDRRYWPEPTDARIPWEYTAARAKHWDTKGSTMGNHADWTDLAGRQVPAQKETNTAGNTHAPSALDNGTVNYSW